MESFKNIVTQNTVEGVDKKREIERDGEVRFDELPDDIQNNSYLKKMLNIPTKWEEAFRDENIISDLTRLIKKPIQPFRGRDLIKDNVILHFRKSNITQVFREKHILEQNESFPFGVDYNTKTRTPYLKLRDRNKQLVVGEGYISSVKILKNINTQGFRAKKTKNLAKARASQEADAIVRNMIKEGRLIEKVHEKNINLSYRYSEKQEQFKIDLQLPWFGTKDLFDYIANKEITDELLCYKIILQVAIELEKLHALGILHLDLKPENIRLKIQDDIIQVWIIDFDASEEASARNKSNDLIVKHDSCGTPMYRDPRIKLIDKKLEYSSRHDTYSLIFILFLMLRYGDLIKAKNNKEYEILYYLSLHLSKEIKTPKYADELCQFMVGEKFPTLQTFIRFLHDKIRSFDHDKKAEKSKVVDASIITKKMSEDVDKSDKPINWTPTIFQSTGSFAHNRRKLEDDQPSSTHPKMKRQMTKKLS